MKSLVIFDSNYGNTKKIADAIAKGIGTKALPIAAVNPNELKELDLLVVGTPINGWRPTVNMQDYLDELPDLKGIKATAFDTRVKLFIHGDAKDKVASCLYDAGAKIIVKPMAFYVTGPKESPELLEGELDKAVKWGKEICSLTK